MKYIFKILLYILNICNIICISTNDYCIRIQNDCNGFFGFDQKYDIKCLKTTCKGKLNYKCGLDFCARNKRSCETISNLMFLLKTYKGLLLFEKEHEKYSNFIGKIKKCSMKTYAIQSNDAYAKKY